MAMSGNNPFAIGDWVMGRSRDGELVSGYIETVDQFQRFVKVHVLESDNYETIGKSIGILYKSVEKLPVSNKISEEQVLHLIDLALTTNDKQWFTDLSATLIEIRSQSKSAAKQNTVYSAGANRMGELDTRS